MNKDYWEGKFSEANNLASNGDDLLFIVNLNNEIKVVRKPYTFTEDDKIDYKQTVKLNKVIQEQFLIAVTVCSVKINSPQIICVQRFLDCCFPTPNLSKSLKYLEFNSAIFPEFLLNQRDSLLCIEIILPAQNFNLSELEDEYKGTNYRSIRDLGRVIYEGSISFEDILAMFKPLNFTKALVLRGLHDHQGRIILWVTKKLPFFSSKENSQLRIKVNNMEIEWNSIIM